jgi:type VII secretion protein EccE
LAPGQPGTVRRGGPAKRRPIHRGRLFGVRAGQLVATQVAVVLLVVGYGVGPLALAGAAVVAAALLAGAWGRVGGRWAYQWLGTVLQFAGRRHTLEADADLLELVAPGTRISAAELAGESTAIIADGYGLTVVLEIGDPNALLVDDALVLPQPETLLPTGTEGPAAGVQLLLTAAPAPALRAGASQPANSYRQLTEGRVLSHSRAVLAVRVLRAEGWSGEDLGRFLSSLVRRLPRRLGGVPVRPLGESAVARALAELAHHSGHQPVQESWDGLRAGGLAQATFRLGRWPDPRNETARRLVGRLLSLPASATTVALAVGPRQVGGCPVEATIRLAAPDGTELNLAAEAMRRLLAGEGAAAYRLDGDHLAGLAATLPLGARPGAPPPGMPTEERSRPGVLDGLVLNPAGGGLMLGANRHGAPVVARLFRPEPTRALLVGGVAAAQVIVLRAMALGTRVVVQTARPQAWEPFVRGAAVPGESIALIPPGRMVEMPGGTALVPVLHVVDVGPVGADTRPGQGWQATLVVRDEFVPADVDLALRADLLLLQPLRPDEADLCGSALGLGNAAQWLTRIRADMIGVVNRRAVRWVALAGTPIEQQLIGPLTRW